MLPDLFYVFTHTWFLWECGIWFSVLSPYRNDVLLEGPVLAFRGAQPLLTHWGVWLGLFETPPGMPHLTAYWQPSSAQSWSPHIMSPGWQLSTAHTQHSFLFIVVR